MRFTDIFVEIINYLHKYLTDNTLYMNALARFNTFPELQSESGVDCIGPVPTEFLNSVRQNVNILFKYPMFMRRRTVQVYYAIIFVHKQNSSVKFGGNKVK